MARTETVDGTLRLTGGGASELRADIGAAYRADAADSMKLAELVWRTSVSEAKHAQTQKWVPVWKLWGYTTWHDFAGQELQMHGATAYLYRKVWQKFGIELKVGNYASQAALLPISKMAALCPVVNAKNLNEWLIKGYDLSCKKLRAEVRFALTGDVKSADLRLGFLMSEAQAKKVNRAIDLISDRFGMKRKSDAVVKLVDLAQKQLTAEGKHLAVAKTSKKKSGRKAA